VVAACRDITGVRNRPPADGGRGAPGASLRNAGAGAATTLTYTLTPDPVYGSANLVVPDSERYKHVVWVKATATGSVRRVATYSWTETPNDTTFDATQGYVYVDRGNGSRYYIGPDGVDIQLLYWGGYLAPQSVGMLGHGAGTIGLDNYAPPGYPHVDCGPSKTIHCEEYSGSVSVTITPYASDLVLTVDSTSYAPGSIAVFGLTLSQPVVAGHSMAYEPDSSWWEPDSPGDVGGTSDPPISGPGLAACSSQYSGCGRRVVGSGTFSVSGWVNGVWQKRSVRVNAPTLKLTALPMGAHVGDSITFTPTWSNGTAMAAGNISGWTWTPDEPPGHLTACASVYPCRAKVQEWGTMGVTVTRNSVTRTASVHVITFTTFTLDADQNSIHAGDTVTFTPKYDGVPGAAPVGVGGGFRGRWRSPDLRVRRGDVSSRGAPLGYDVGVLVGSGRRLGESACACGTAQHTTESHTELRLQW